MPIRHPRKKTRRPNRAPSFEEISSFDKIFFLARRACDLDRLIFGTGFSIRAWLASEPGLDFVRRYPAFAVHKWIDLAPEPSAADWKQVCEVRAEWEAELMNREKPVPAAASRPRRTKDDADWDEQAELTRNAAATRSVVAATDDDEPAGPVRIELGTRVRPS